MNQDGVDANAAATSKPPDSAGMPAATLNPEAGAHPITQDPDALRAALRASARMLARYPYFEIRFGERGKRFSDSDSAWLATLVEYPQTLVDAQVGWLAGVLASRGIPRILLERHLRVLVEELRPDDANPAPTGAALNVAVLIRAAQGLAERRSARIDDAHLESIGRAFDAALGEAAHPCRPGIGDIIGGAVADEADGLADTVSSTLGWLSDPDRFSDHWIAAVEQAVARARALVTRDQDEASTTRGARATAADPSPE